MSTAPSTSWAVDEAAIRALFERACQAWCDGDAVAYAACFTDGCDYVSFDGNWTTGTEPVVAAHDALFRGVLYGSRLVGEVRAVRQLTGDVVLVQAEASVLVAWRRTLPKGRRTQSSIVAVRDGERWRFAAMNNSRIRPLTVPGPDSMPARMARLLVRLTRACGLGGPASPRAEPVPRP